MELKDDEVSMHKMIMNARNEFYAHNDPKHNRIFILMKKMRKLMLLPILVTRDFHIIKMQFFIC